jgi:hypothetical protein
VYFELFAKSFEVLEVHLTEVRDLLANIPESGDGRLELVVPRIVYKPDLEDASFLVFVVIVAPCQTRLTSSCF